MVASPEILALERLRQDPKPKTAPGNKLPNAMLWLRGKGKEVRIRWNNVRLVPREVGKSTSLDTRMDLRTFCQERLT